jgi:beta-N-acetylhexosaminidase
MNVERAAAACLFPGFAGLRSPEWVRRWVERGLGGVVLFGQNIESTGQVRDLNASLRAERDDLLVATDEEGGDVTRLEARRGSSYPGNWALGIVDDPELTEGVAASIAAELAGVGINLDFAPVADVNSNPDNPVIGIRSFGREPSLVARHVRAFVTGLQGGGVAGCAKHFPGHGDTSQDSHLELPVVEGNVAEALEPFRAAIDAGVRSIMTAHVLVPELAAQQATLSREILQELLRDELGFGGVAITDALEMRAVADTVGVEEGAVLALAAGADALCLGADIDEPIVSAVHAAVVDAVREGRLAEERLGEAAGRVQALAVWAATPPASTPRPELGARAAALALRSNGAVGLSAPPLIVDLRPSASIAAGEAGHGLADIMDVAAAVVVREGDPLPEPNGRPLVVVVRDAHRHEWERAAVERLLGQAPQVVVVETGLPLWQPEGAAYVASYGGGRANLEAAATELHLAAADR